MSDANSQNFGFRISYDDEDGSRTSIQVKTGYSSILPDADHQTLTFANDRLPFSLEAEVGDGLIRRIEFATRGSPRSLEQKHLRTSGLVPLIRQWARLGRELQLAERPADAEFLVELPHMANVQDAIAATRNAIQSWAPSASLRRRARGQDGQQLLLRVVGRYRELVKADHPSPRVVIAAEESYTPEHIGRLLVRARREGLLSPARPGRAGEQSEEES